MINEWAYILSPSFSGSTLLTFLLGAHPAVATVGELKATAMGDVQAYQCSCGRRILECPFWRRVRDGMENVGRSFDVADFRTEFRFNGRGLADRVLRARVRGPLFETTRTCFLAVAPGVRREVSARLEQNVALAEVILREQRGRVFLDGSKEPARLLHLSRSPGVKLKVLHLIRDGRGTASSFMKHYDMPMVEAAGVWQEAQKECGRVAKRFTADSVMVVHYETLCAAPDASLAEIFRFLGLNPADAARDFGRVEQHILGNAMRLTSSSEIRQDEKWRSQLAPQDVEVFDRIAGALNRRLGYA